MEETDDIKHKKPPQLTASEDDTSDGPGSERNKDAGRGPGELLTHVAAPEDVAADDFNDHSLKDTNDSRNLSGEAGLEVVTAPQRRTQRIRKKTRRAKTFELIIV